MDHGLINEKICRACLSDAKDLRSIYKIGKICNERVKLCDILNECTSLEFDENDGLPCFLCIDCILLLSKFYSFRKLCFRSNAALRRNRLKRDSRKSKTEVIHSRADSPRQYKIKSMSIKTPLPDANEIVEMPTDDETKDDFEYVTVIVSQEEQEPEDGNEQANEDDESNEYRLIQIEPSDDMMDIKMELINGAGVIQDGEEIEEQLGTEDERDEDTDKNTKEFYETEEYLAEDDENSSLCDGVLDKTPVVKPLSRQRRGNKSKKYTCEECGKVLSNFNSYKYHKQLHSDKTPFLCSECGEGFKTRNAYEGHRITHLPSNPNKCSICGKTYRQAASLRCHMLSHTGEKPYVCGICGKAMTQKSGYKKHMLTHTGEKPYQCDECGKYYRFSSNLIIHKKAHSGEKNHKCDVCEKRFLSTEQLKRHAIIHTGEKPFKCDICSKCFNRSSSLKFHRNRHNREKKNICNYCNKTYCHLQSLQAHIHLVHKRKNVVGSLTAK